MLAALCNIALTLRLLWTFFYISYGWMRVHQVHQMLTRSTEMEEAQQNNCSAIGCRWQLRTLSASACSKTARLFICGRPRREDSCGRVPTVAYADAFGAAGAGGSLTYYLATAFDKVSLTRHIITRFSHAFLAHIRQPAAHIQAGPCICRCTCSPQACSPSAAWPPARLSCATSLRSGKCGHFL